LLLVDAIYKNQLGNIEQSEIALKASWKLSKSLHNRSDLLSYIIFIVNSNELSFTLPKLQGISSAYWKEQIEVLLKQRFAKQTVKHLCFG
jgi:hypothetical protein